MKGPACRKCGCTDSDCAGCVDRTGAPCWWIEADLCSACADPGAPALLPAEALARGLCVRHGLTGALVMALDQLGGLHLGCAAIDHPITKRFVELAHSINIACERLEPGKPTGISRELAVSIARRCAKAKPQSYYAEPFEPHEWVVDAIMAAAAELPPVRAACIHCKQEVCAATDVDAIRLHAMTCKESPVVQELTRAIVDQARVIARRWDTQDGVNGAELDTLRDIVYDRPGASE